MDGALADIERQLDERARAALRELPEDVAANLLRDCQTRSVRNPSAYVFVAARKARPSQLKDTIERLHGDLDDKACAQLRELPPEQSMRILDELAQNWDQVRNPSAYVSTAVKNFFGHTSGRAGVQLPSGGALLGGPMDHAMAGMMGVPMGFGLMAGMGPAPMAGPPGDPLAGGGPPMGPPPMGPMMGPAMGAPPGAPLASPLGGPMGGTPMPAPLGPPMGPPLGPPMGAMGPPLGPLGGPAGSLGPLARPGGCGGGFGEFGGCGFGGPCGQPGCGGCAAPGMSQKQLEQELECAIVRLGLDEIANEALHRVPLETAREIVQALDGGVRNPSAFVMSKIRSFQDGPGGGAGGPGRAPGPAQGGCGPERPPESRAELQRRNEAALERFGADDRARSIAREIPPDALFDIFNQLGHNMREIRNPSAFIFQACVNYQKQHPQPTGYPSYPPQQPFVMRPGATPEQVDEAIVRLELDAAAAADMRALPPESAMGILDQITEGVKNKSAFATTAARRITGRLRSRSRSRSRSRRRGEKRPRSRSRSRGRGHSPSRDRSREERRGRTARHLSRTEAMEVVERMIGRCDLDDQAARAMRALHSDDAMRIMEDIQRNADVRNASAFAYTAAKKLLGSLNLEDAKRKFDLDETAIASLSSVLPSEAREILDSIDDGLRNPSAFVTAQVRRMRPESAPLAPHAGRGLGGGLPPGASVREMEEEAESLIRQLGLDERAAGVLHEVPLPRAIDILGELRRNRNNVRNPSAYVFNACVKEINNPAAKAAGLGGLDGGGAFGQPLPGMTFGAPAGMAGLPLGMPPPTMPGLPQGPAGAPPQSMVGQVPSWAQAPPASGPVMAPGMPAPASSEVDAAARKAEVERAIEKWNLDEAALGALLQIPADQALEILNSLDAGVRNPSAFVTTAARKRSETGALGPPVAGGSLGMADGDAADFRRSLQEQVENLIRRSELDEKAAGLLRELPLEGALEILGELQRKWEQVRNPSAYVFNAGVKFQEKLAHGGRPSQAPNPAARRAQHVEALAARLRLDADAVHALHTVPLEAAAGILEQMHDGLGDPSDFVRRTVERMHQRAAGFSEPAVDPYASGEQAMAQRAEGMALELGVDENSLAALQTVPLEHAVQLLNRLAESRQSVRDPSAFIVSAVKDFRAQATGGGFGPPGP